MNLKNLISIKLSYLLYQHNSTFHVDINQSTLLSYTAVTQSNNSGMTIIANTRELPQYVAETGHDDIKRT